MVHSLASIGTSPPTEHIISPNDVLGHLHSKCRQAGSRCQNLHGLLCTLPCIFHTKPVAKLYTNTVICHVDMIYAVYFEQQHVGAGDQAHLRSECFPVGGDVHPGVFRGPALWCAKRLHNTRTLTALYSCVQCFCVDAVVQSGEFGAIFALRTPLYLLCKTFVGCASVWCPFLTCQLHASACFARA